MAGRDLRDRLHLSGMDGNAAALARQQGLGLEITAFAWAPELENEAAWERTRGDMAGLDRFWLHAPFAELIPCAIDPQVREVARQRYRQTLAAAERLGVKQVIVHGGFIPYVYYPAWYVEQSVEFWQGFLREVPADVSIALENVMEPGPELLVDIIRQVDDPRLGLCLDVGHANTVVSKVPPLEWIGPMAPWLRHVHLHNNLGDTDLHDDLGSGIIPMETVLDCLLAACPQATMTLELMNCAPSLTWLRERGYLGEDPYDQ